MNGDARHDDAVRPRRRAQLDLDEHVLGQQLLVLRREVVHQPVQPGPEALGLQPGAGQRLLLDEVHQGVRDLEVALLDHVGVVSFECVAPGAWGRRAYRAALRSRQREMGAPR